MAISTTKATFGSILGAVSTAATTVTSVLDVATDSVSMASNFVTKAKNEQALQYQHDAIVFEEELTSATEIRIADITMAQSEYSGKSKAHASALTEAKAKLQAALAKNKA